MKFVPRGERAEWHAKAIATLDGADLSSRIEILVMTREWRRVAKVIESTAREDLMALSHYAIEPVVKKLGRSHPLLVAKLRIAMGLRIVEAKKIDDIRPPRRSTPAPSSGPVGSTRCPIPGSGSPISMTPSSRRSRRHAKRPSRPRAARLHKGIPGRGHLLGGMLPSGHSTPKRSRASVDTARRGDLVDRGAAGGCEPGGLLMPTTGCTIAPLPRVPVPRRHPPRGCRPPGG